MFYINEGAGWELTQSSTGWKSIKQGSQQLCLEQDRKFIERQVAMAIWQASIGLHVIVFLIQKWEHINDWFMWSKMTDSCDHAWVSFWAMI